jgi:hypothetical protein
MEKNKHNMREYMGKIIILTKGSLTKPCDMKQDMNQPKSPECKLSHHFPF